MNGYHRFASFYVGGGQAAVTRVELWQVGESKPFYSARGRNTEDLSRVVVDLQRVMGREIEIHIVDESRSAWGHVNFDHFRFHAKRPGPVTPSSVELVVDEYPHSGLAASDAAAAMRVPDGFRVTVAAAEPAVKQPIAMALDDRGRVWIAEAYEYPQRAEGDTGRDRILVFEDTTGDGQLDSRTVFFEGLNLVSGLEVGFGGVWVGAAPYLMFIPDANGDDQADGPPQILLDGWGYEDTHETLNAFCWGPDGWLYGCHGVFTHSRVGKPGAPDAERTPLNAGVWRYHPLRHQFEVFAHGTSNPWGVDFDRYGEAFATACVIPHLYHFIPGARYQRQAGQHFNKYTYDDIKTIADHLHYLGNTPHSGNGKSDEAGGGHAHAGAMIYQGGAWPKEYTGALFMNNIHGQRLNVDLLEPQGSGYVGRHGDDFLLTGDMASQILNMRYGPDGQVTVIDWYDMQACHRREVEVHDRSNGRIYRIVHGDARPVQVDLQAASDLELAEYCLHENEWYVKHARRILQERSRRADGTRRAIDAVAVERLRSLAREHDQATRRLRALWSLHCIDALDPQLALELLKDTSPNVRAWVVRLTSENASELFALERAEAHQAMLERTAGDPSPIVRLATASALMKQPVESRWAALATLTSHSADAQDHNLPLMYWYALEPLAEVDPDRALAAAMQAGEQIPLLRQFMLRRVAGSGEAEAVQRLVIALRSVQDVDQQRNFLNALRLALQGQRQAAAPKEWQAVFAGLMDSPDAHVVMEASAVGVIFGDARALSKLEHMLADGNAPSDLRVAAMDALLAVEQTSLLPKLLLLVEDPQQHPSELVQAAIRGLAQFDETQPGSERATQRSTARTTTAETPIASALLDGYSRFDANQRRAAIATLCSRSGSARQLLTAIAAKQIPASDLSADLARQIDYFDNPQLSEQLQNVWGSVRESSAEKAQQMSALRQLVEQPDAPNVDLSLGRAMFAKTCQRCHVLYGEGEKLGPDLTGSNRANLDYLLENIVDPSAVMAKEYRQSVFLTDTGQVITGIVREETSNAVTVQTADAKVVIPTEEIVQRQESELSMMPENQLQAFADHEVRSLIAYLRGKVQVSLPSEDGKITSPE